MSYDSRNCFDTLLSICNSFLEDENIIFYNCHFRPSFEFKGTFHCWVFLARTVSPQMELVLVRPGSNRNGPAYGLEPLSPAI